MTKEVLKLALEALELEDMACRYEKESTPEHIAKAITAIKEALAQPERLAELGWQEIDCPICGGGARAFPKPEQEPMAWIERDMQCDDFDPDSVTCEKPTIAADGWEWVALYTTPPQRTERYTYGTPLLDAFTKPAPVQEPVQVSPLEFVTMVMEKEHLVGKPLFWAEWPNKE